MRFVTCFAVLGLSLVMGACFLNGTLNIDIGNYEAQLAAWNNQNMRDYLLYVSIFDFTGMPTDALVTVKDGTPVSSDPPSWLEEGRRSTIPEYYSLIKSEEKEIITKHKKTTTDSYTLTVKYNTEYRYPKYIYSEVSHKPLIPGNWSGTRWEITLTPLPGGGE